MTTGYLVCCPFVIGFGFHSGLMSLECLISSFSLLEANHPYKNINATSETKAHSTQDTAYHREVRCPRIDTSR
jgi:hypothetical protein